MGRKMSPAVGIIIVLVVAAVAAFLIWKYTSAPTVVTRPPMPPEKGVPAAVERREGERRGETREPGQRRGGRRGGRGARAREGAGEREPGGR